MSHEKWKNDKKVQIAVKYMAKTACCGGECQNF